MKKRITVVLDDDLVKKLHIIQAKLMRKYTKSVSFSSVITDILEKEL
jgi:predicted transcriptional regulator